MSVHAKLRARPRLQASASNGGAPHGGRLMADSGPLAVIAIASDEQAKPIRAFTKARQLTCSKLELAALTDFRDRWVERLRG
jgi:hypothetical protein